jgi:hypothetical protein
MKIRLLILLLLTTLLAMTGHSSALAHPGHGETQNADDGYSYVYWYETSTGSAGQISSGTHDVIRAVVPPCRKFTYDRDFGTNVALYNTSTTTARSIYVADNEWLRILNIEVIC